MTINDDRLYNSGRLRGLLFESYSFITIINNFKQNKDFLIKNDTFYPWLSEIIIETRKSCVSGRLVLLCIDKI